MQGNPSFRVVQIGDEPMRLDWVEPFSSVAQAPANLDAEINNQHVNGAVNV